MHHILLIDDEPNILSALRRCLAAIDVDELDGEPLKIETFTSPEAAIARSEEQDFDLIISDYRMPSMDGVELLSRLMEIQPAAPRVIISGYADRAAIIAAINEAHLVRFVEKPWEDEALRRTVVDILGAASPRTTSARGNDRQTRQLRRLEQDSPGITQLERDEHGAIILHLDDLEE